MPALLGYLVALVVLLGGGYAGLEWLGSPDEPPASLHPRATTSAASKHLEARKPVTSADAAESVAPVGIPESSKVGHDQAKANDASAEPVKAKAPDAAPADGCKPIGLTASGQMVFPLQCRASFEARADAAVPPASEPKASEPKASEPKASEPKALAQNQDKTQTSAQPNDASAKAAVTIPPNEASSTSGAPVSAPVPPRKDAEADESALTKTPPRSVSGQSGVIAPKQLAEQEPARAALGSVTSTSPITGPARKFSAEIRTPKPEKSKSTPDRSRLVKMTLLTIEYPDGHREQRLVPYRRFRNSPDFDFDDY